MLPTQSVYTLAEPPHPYRYPADKPLCDYTIESYRILMTDSECHEESGYLRCPVWDRAIKAGESRGDRRGSEFAMVDLEKHIRSDHQMMKVRKGSNYR